MIESGPSPRIACSEAFRGIEKASHTMTFDDLLYKLWDDYATLNPQARAIHNLLQARGERIVNDHIALRTYDDPRVSIDRLARAFEKVGYTRQEEYDFEQKKLFARHFEHDDPNQPKVFISELQLAKCSDALRAKVAALLDQLPGDQMQRDDAPVAGRSWDLSFADYEALAAESEYAGWVAAFGFRANHFTVFVNALTTFESLQALNTCLKQNGYALNDSGGEVKGSPDVFLEQSSTLADQVEVKFSDGTHVIPACYYEFARRYPLPSGELFQGFVAKSADKIFESTDRR